MATVTGSAVESAAIKPRLPWPRRLLRLAAFVVIQAVVVFVLLENIARVLDPFGISYYPETARYLDTMIKEEPIGYRHQPNLEGRYYGAQVSINSLGLRDRDLSLDPAQDEFRILIMGDSMPFGIGVDYEDSIPHQIELLANEYGDRWHQFRTVNMGVPSYNTEQQLVQFETLGMALKPRLVVLFYSFNDVEPKMWVFNKRSALLADLAQRSYAASLLFVTVRQLLQGGGGAAAMDPRYHLDSPRWQAVDRSVTQLHARCREAGIPFVVFWLACPGGPAVEMVRELGRREGFPVLPLHTKDDPRWADMGQAALVNSVSDSHPNQAGSRAYGTMVYEQLAALDVLR